MLTFAGLTTLNIVFNVTSYLELHIAMTIYYMYLIEKKSIFLSTHVNFYCSDIIEHYLKYVLDRKLLTSKKNIALRNSK